MRIVKFQTNTFIHLLEQWIFEQELHKLFQLNGSNGVYYLLDCHQFSNSVAVKICNETRKYPFRFAFRWQISATIRFDRPVFVVTFTSICLSRLF